MTTFVLVHGESHGSWCWDKVVTLLEAQGYQAIAVDLPGIPGRDKNPSGIQMYRGAA